MPAKVYPQLNVWDLNQVVDWSLYLYTLIIEGEEVREQCVMVHVFICERKDSDTCNFFCVRSLYIKA